MGGNSNVAMTLSILKDEIKDYPFASAFTFVRTIGQHENAPKSTSGEEDDKTIFQNTPRRSFSQVVVSLRLH